MSDLAPRSHDPDRFWQWYFTPGVRMLAKLPVLLLFGTNSLLLAPLILTTSLDYMPVMFRSRFTFTFIWDLLGLLSIALWIALLVGPPILLSALPWRLLPLIWDRWTVSSFVKAPLWLTLAVVALLLPWRIVSLVWFAVLVPLSIKLPATEWYLRSISGLLP